MQTAQQSNSNGKLPVEEIINEYKGYISDIIGENVNLRVYINQLEKQIDILNAQLEMATTTVTHANNDDIK